MINDQRSTTMVRVGKSRLMKSKCEMWSAIASLVLIGWSWKSLLEKIEPIVEDSSLSSMPLNAQYENIVVAPGTPSSITWCSGEIHVLPGRCSPPDRVIEVTNNLLDFQYRLRQALDARRWLTSHEKRRLDSIFEGKLISGWPFTSQRKRGQYSTYSLYAHTQNTPGLLNAENRLWLEFGVYTGSSVNVTSYSQRNNKAVAIHGFDTFTGLPERWHGIFGKGFFSLDGNLPPVEPGVTLHKGLFNDTLPGFLQENAKEKIAGINIDCDLYRGAIEIFNLTHKMWTPGTMLHFHEGQEHDNSPVKNITSQQEIVALHEFLVTHPGFVLELLPIRSDFSEPVVFFVVSVGHA